MGLLSAARVTILARSSLWPGTITLGGDDAKGASGGAGAGAGGGAAFDPLGWLRPHVRVLAGGAELLDWQPRGAPPGVPWVGVGLVVIVVGGLLGLGYSLGRRRRG